MNRFATDFWLPCPPERAFDFFAEARNLNRVTPPWFRFELLTPMPILMAVGTRIDYWLRWRLARLAWTSEVTLWEPPRRFDYEQTRGPFRRFRHAHLFRAEAGGVRVVDVVDYAVAGGAFAARLLVEPDLRRIFQHRARAAPRLVGAVPAQPTSAAAPSRKPRSSASSSAIEEPT